MTTLDTGDASQVGPLLDQIEVPVGQFTADGAYDGKPSYDAVTKHSADAPVVIPPRANAVDRSDTQSTSQRDRHIASIDTDGRMTWQIATGYGKRSLVETAIGRYKSIIGRRLRARSFRTQQTEVAIAVATLNRMLACARPKSVRCKKATASRIIFRNRYDPCTIARSNTTWQTNPRCPRGSCRLRQSHPDGLHFRES